MYKLKKSTNTSIPVSYSNTAIAIPYDTSTMSVINPHSTEETKQYTVADLLFEEGSESQNTYQGALNYTNVQINDVATFNGLNSYIRINGTQTSFNNLLVDFTFQPLNLTKNQVIVAKLDWGTPIAKKLGNSSIRQKHSIQNIS